MKIVLALFFALACVEANTIHYPYGWAPETESLYRFQSQILSGIPEIRNTQLAGVTLKANIRVQALRDSTLRVKIERPELISLNGEVSLTKAGRVIGNGGALANAKTSIPQEFQAHLEKPFLVHLKRGLVKSFFIDPKEPVSITNIKKSFLSQIQLDVTGAGFQPKQFKTVQNEESTIGRCPSLYSINALTPARVVELERLWEQEEQEAQVSASTQGKAACSGKQYYEIIKTRDLDNCEFRPAFQQVSGAEFNGDVTKASIGDMMTHMVSSATYVCGQLSSFNIRKTVMDETVVRNPIGYNTQQHAKTSTYIVMELQKTSRIQQQIQIPAHHTWEETSLVYTYPAEREFRHQISRQVRINTALFAGTHPILPHPPLMEAPQLLVDVNLSKQDIKTKILQQLKTLSKIIFESPESCTSEIDVPGQILSIAKFFNVFSKSELEQVWTQALAGLAGQQKEVTKKLLLDTAAMTGTNPTTMLVLEKITSAEVSTAQAVDIVQSAFKSIKTPTEELVRKLIQFVQNIKTPGQDADKQKLLTSTLFQLSNLLHRAYVNPLTMVSNFPVRIYGVFGTPWGKFFNNEVIPMFEQMLEESRSNDQNGKQLRYVLIAAIGKLGDLEAAKSLIKVAQGDHNEEPMERSLAIYSMKRVTKQNPFAVKRMLLAIVNNPLEDADVRVAALTVLPWARPTYADLQTIAIRSWFDASNQVSSFARSTFESLANTEVPELKPVAVKAKTTLHFFKPAYYGMEFSKNIHSSKFVRYLLATVASKFAYTATKDTTGFSQVAYNTELFSKTLGEAGYLSSGFNGLKINLRSFTAYSQGMQQVIDRVLESANDFVEVSQNIRNELAKIATELNLTKRVPREFRSFIQARTLGYEYADLLTLNKLQTMYSKIKSTFATGMPKWYTKMVSAANLVSMEFYGPTEAGFPVYNALNYAQVMTASMSAEIVSSQAQQQQLMANTNIVPALHAKVQTAYLVISPFTNEMVGTGVTMSLHASLPVKATIKAEAGEMNINLKVPDEILTTGKRHEVVHAYIIPYNVRSLVNAPESINKAYDLQKIVSGKPLHQLHKQFNGAVNGEFNYESDNKFVDFASYWNTIQQNSVDSLSSVFPLMSTVRMSSVKLLIDPRMSEVKEISLKLRLWSQQPNKLMNLISKPVNQEAKQSLEVAPYTLKPAFSDLQGSPATIFNLQTSLQEASSVKTVEFITVFGYQPLSVNHMKTKVAAAVKLPVGSRNQVLSVLFEDELKRANVNSRWNKEEILQQPLNMIYNAHLTYAYGPEGSQPTRNVIVLKSDWTKSQAFINAVRQSDDWNQCTRLENAGRKLSPICIKARHQAGSLDTAKFSMQFPQEMYSSPVLRDVETFVLTHFWPYYKPILSQKQMSQGQLNIGLTIARKGNVAQAKVEYPGHAYELENVRIPHALRGAIPLSARNLKTDLVGQNKVNNYNPKSCRIESDMVTTFDGKKYGYKINDCEHVLMMDGTRAMPISVTSRTVSGNKKAVKVLAHETKIEIIPESGVMKVKVDGQEISIAPGTTYVSNGNQNGVLLFKIKHYNDGVFYVILEEKFYTPNLHIITDGKNIEIPDELCVMHARTVGLCGDMNGETVADLPSPQQCILEPKMAAYSYMLANAGDNQRCAGIPTADLPEFRRQSQECLKEKTIPTPLLPIFEHTLRSSKDPLVSAEENELGEGGVMDMIRDKYSQNGSALGRLGGNGVWECAKKCMGNPLMSIDECIKACYRATVGEKSSGAADDMGPRSRRNSNQDGETGMGENWN